MADKQSSAAKSTGDAQKAQEGKRRPESSQVREAMQGTLTEVSDVAQRLGASTADPPLDSHAALLGDRRLSHPANAAQRVHIVGQLQRTYGNRYVQAVAQRITDSRLSGPGATRDGVLSHHANMQRPREATSSSPVSQIATGSGCTVQLDPVYYGTRTCMLQVGWNPTQAEFTGTVWEVTRGRLGSVIPFSWFAWLWGRSNIVDIHRRIAGIPELPGGTNVSMRGEYTARGTRMEDASLTFTLLNEPALRRRSRELHTEPVTRRWAIRLGGAGGIGGAVAGEVLICEICDRDTGIGTAFEYLGAGAGLAVRASVSSGVGPGSWQYVTTARPAPLSAWTGRGSVTSSGFGAGGIGVGSTVLSFHRMARWNHGHVVDVEFSSAPTFLNVGFSATTGFWDMQDVLYPMSV